MEGKAKKIIFDTDFIYIREIYVKKIDWLKSKIYIFFTKKYKRYIILSIMTRKIILMENLENSLYIVAKIFIEIELFYG